jgi:hypothetical protein
VGRNPRDAALFLRLMRAALDSEAMDTQKTYIGEKPDMARRFVGIEMDRPRVLAFDSAATFLIYQRYGAQFFLELFEPDPNAPEPGQEERRAMRLRSHDAFVFFLWAGLQRDAKAAGESLTLDQVADQIVPTSIGDLAQSLLVALSATRRAKPPENLTKNA